MFGERKEFNLFSLLVGILAVVLSLLIIKNPLGSFTSLIYMMAILLLVDGISKWSDIKSIRTYSKTWLYIGAGYDIFLGILMLFLPFVGAVLIWFLLAVFILYNAGLELWLNQKAFLPRNGSYWINLILGVIGLLIGILVLFQPYLAISITLFWVSFFFMFYGIIKIIRSV
ncbi:HdeD family acid-resistance protein [Lactobacillaceae bacterium Scapto_B20]